jgi:tripartite-type tricarboxylate transporter receptor subunit TctC
MKYGHNGKSMVQYMAMTTIAKAEKVTLVDVPFNGDPSQVAALLGGHIPVITPTFSPVKPLWEAKKVKILAVLNEKRAEFLPGIPSIYEMGYKVPAATFTGLFAPKGTPDEVIKKLFEVVQKIREEQDFQAKTKRLDLEVAHEDLASFEKSIVQLKERLRIFFKEEGMVKQN